MSDIYPGRNTGDGPAPSTLRKRMRRPSGRSWKRCRSLRAMWNSGSQTASSAYQRARPADPNQRPVRIRNRNLIHSPRLVRRPAAKQQVGDVFGQRVDILRAEIESVGISPGTSQPSGDSVDRCRNAPCRRPGCGRCRNRIAAPARSGRRTPSRLDIAAGAGSKPACWGASLKVLPPA